MLLAIDTSTTLTGIAVVHEHGVLGECTWYSGRNHSAQVMPQLAMLLNHLGILPPDLSAVAVALGPGSWSGLRVGISIAKGVAYAGQLAIIGLSTLDVLAYQHRQGTLGIYPLIRLGRGRFATAAFAEHTDEWNRVSDYRNVSLDELCEEINDDTLFCGDIDETVRQHLRRNLNERAYFPRPADALRRSGYLAELAWQRFQAGSHDDLARLEPIYLGAPVKTE